MTVFRLLFPIFLLLLGVSLCRAWYQPTTIKSPEVRLKFEAWRDSLGTGPFLAAHVALPFSLGATGLAAAVAPNTSLVGNVRAAALILTGIYLAVVSLTKFRSLRQTQSGAQALRTCIGVSVLALVLGVYLGMPLLEQLNGG